MNKEKLDTDDSKFRVDATTEEKMIPGVHVRSQRLTTVKPQYQTKVMGVMSILGVGKCASVQRSHVSLFDRNVA